MIYETAMEKDLVFDREGRYHALCDELDYVMSLRTKLVEVFIGDEYKNNHSAANALREAIRRSDGVYPIKVHECNNRLFLRRTDM